MLLKEKSVWLTLLLLANVCLSTNSVAAEASQPSYTYDESAYTKETEKKMDKMHMLFMRALDKKASAGERRKATNEYLVLGQELVQSMHARVMAKDVKGGAALSPTEVVLSVHMMTMMIDMLAAIQLEEWKDPSLQQ